DQSVDRQRPIFARDARQAQVTEHDRVFNPREPILHLVRDERNAADVLVRVELRADHGAFSNGSARAGHDECLTGTVAITASGRGITALFSTACSFTDKLASRRRAST